MGVFVNDPEESIVVSPNEDGEDGFHEVVEKLMNSNDSNLEMSEMKEEGDEVAALFRSSYKNVDVAEVNYPGAGRVVVNFEITYGHRRDTILDILESEYGATPS